MMLYIQHNQKYCTISKFFAPLFQQTPDKYSLFKFEADSRRSIQLMLTHDGRSDVQFLNKSLTRNSVATMSAIRETVATVIRQLTA